MNRICVSLCCGAVLALLAVGCLSFHNGPPPGKPEVGELVEIEGDAIHFLDTGKVGEDQKAHRGNVMLVHGFGSSLLEFAAVIKQLKAQRYRVLAIDLLGHGWSARPAGDYSVAAQARRVLALANLRKVDRFALVGHSWGSAIALSVTLAEPKRVSRVALYAGMFFEEQRPTLFSWARLPVLGEIIYGAIYPDRQDEKVAFAFYDPERYVDEEMVERVEQVMDRPGTLAAALAGVRAMSYSELEQHYGEVGQPVLIMWGREDNVTPLTWGEQLQNRLANARLVVYPQCGHMPFIEAEGASINELLRFLAEEAS